MLALPREACTTCSCCSPPSQLSKSLIARSDYIAIDIPSRYFFSRVAIAVYACARLYLALAFGILSGEWAWYRYQSAVDHLTFAQLQAQHNLGRLRATTLQDQSRPSLREHELPLTFAERQVQHNLGLRSTAPKARPSHLEQERNSTRNQALAQQQTTACPGRRPYHTILTATAHTSQQWQSRIMYYHWQKQRAMDPAGACTEMAGFTRLVAHGNGTPDGLERAIPSFFVREYSALERARFKGYVVMNRPYSVVQLLASRYWRTAVRAEYVYMAETDHILMDVLPNRARRSSPMAFHFKYMWPNSDRASIIEKVWPEGGASGYLRVQSTGPSPVMIHRADLERVASAWESTTVALKLDPRADKNMGWVIEMWGYTIAAAKLGLRHQVLADFQIEPDAHSAAKGKLGGFPERYWIFHYTFPMEFHLDGSPCPPFEIGEYSLNKRNFMLTYPPLLPMPPTPVNNSAAVFLVSALNEAMHRLPDWPTPLVAGSSSSARRVQTLYGYRRQFHFTQRPLGFAKERRTRPLIQQLAGTSWLCNGTDGSDRRSPLELKASGDAVGLSVMGRWGSMNDPTLGAACPVYHCIFIDLWRQGEHDALVSPSATELLMMDHAKGELAWRCDRESAPRQAVVHDAIGVLVCSTLKKVVEAGADLAIRLNYSESEVASLIRIGFGETFRFCDAFYPSRRTATFLESCGVANVIAVCRAGRDAACVAAMAKPRTERGTAEDSDLQMVLRALRARALEHQYPFVATVYRVWFEGAPLSHMAALCQLFNASNRSCVSGGI